MAKQKKYEDWIEEISRSNKDEEEPASADTDTDSDETYTDTDDESFYGFPKRDFADYLYRVIGAKEKIKNKIKCKKRHSDRSVEQHIASGSKNPSKFISTTLSPDVAAHWAFYKMDTKERMPRAEPLRIVEIDTEVLAGTKVEKKCINLCNEDVRNHFIEGRIHRSWAKSSQEVLFKYSIPKYVVKKSKKEQPKHRQRDYVCYEVKLVYDIVKLEKPPQPPPKKDKKKPKKDKKKPKKDKKKPKKGNKKAKQLEEGITKLYL